MDIDTIKRDLKSRIAKGLNFGIEAVEELLHTDTELYNRFILTKSKYSDLMYMSSLNTLAYEQIELGLDRLRNNLIGIIDDISTNSLEKNEIDQQLNVNALPTRRTNFFKLLDIHYLNLEMVSHRVVYSDDKRVENKGREAIYEIYQDHRHRFRKREDIDAEGGKAVLKKEMSEWFSNSIGPLEVYFKNIKHILSYTLASEVEQAFFMNTIKSLFSRFELALMFYYVECGIDVEFKALVLQGELIDHSINDILIRPEHVDGL